MYKCKISNGYELLSFLKAHYCVGDSASWWWPSFQSKKIKDGIEICGGLYSSAPNLSFCLASILGQNTRYSNAWTSLINLYSYFFDMLDSMYSFNRSDVLAFHNYEYPNLAFISSSKWHDCLLNIICNMNLYTMARLISSSGFYNQKSHRIILLSRNILYDFGGFDRFAREVDRTWLLEQKGIGNESASSILNYALKRDEIVVDKYTQKLLASLGHEYIKYEDMQAFLRENLDNARNLYDFDISLAQIMARLHGKIVEHCKRHKIGNFNTINNV
ncbi:hypothetical protein [Helicobacter muridarum]|uniref:3-methyladenine DNA glycosylase n=1 Tax=Helicobacter muridarum TaxID=216 RepID=A0A377PSM6_9HELI|nr:hypothetical protein [Helicobacter muridarum]STQ85291.1 3-methyladenine DNA glycosylase [Helicobacter muridarum]